MSRLIGAPPGYVGYDEGGQLTEAVRRKPYSVILLDEIEKAHPDTFNVLLQVLDDGRLTDNKGRIANFKNTIIIMTSNIGAHIMQERFEGSGEKKEAEQLEIIENTKEEVFEVMKKTVRPEFLNRIDELVMFKPLGREEIRKIVGIQFELIKLNLAHNNISLTASDAALDKLGNLGFDPQFGARPLKRVLQREILNKLSKEIIAGNVTDNSSIELVFEGDIFEFRKK